MQEKPWGYYKVLSTGIEEGIEYTAKVLFISAGNSISLQKHEHRFESWTIASGTGSLIIGDETLFYTPQTTWSIMPDELHRITADTDTIMFEIQLPDSHGSGEDDIVRLSDQYGRTSWQEKE